MGLKIKPIGGERHDFLNRIDSVTRGGAVRTRQDFIRRHYNGVMYTQEEQEWNHH